MHVLFLSPLFQPSGMGPSWGVSKPPGVELAFPPLWGCCRAQKEVKWRQQLLSQNHKLLQSLRVELKVYVRLDEEHQRLRQGTGPWGPGSLCPRAVSSLV